MKMKWIDNFLDKDFNRMEAFFLVCSIFGLAGFVSFVIKINIFLPLGIIFLSIGIYGRIREYYKKRKKGGKK